MSVPRLLSSGCFWCWIKEKHRTGICCSHGQHYNLSPELRRCPQPQCSWKIEKLSEFWFGEPLDGIVWLLRVALLTFHITAVIAPNVPSLLQKRENRVWNKRNVLHPRHVALWSKHAPYFLQNCRWNVENQNLGLKIFFIYYDHYLPNSHLKRFYCYELQ